jgi:molybdopterin-guanine dinucleotide biosynthesis protein A
MGKDKATLPFGEDTILNRLITSLQQEDLPYVVVSSLLHHQDLKAPIIPDYQDNCGPLSGLMAGINYFSTEWVMVVSCDMPFYTPSLVDDLALHTQGHDAVIPVYENKAHYLCGLYRLTCLPMMEERLSNGNLAINKLLEKLNVKWVNMDHYSAPTFMNMNSADDYQEALTLLKKLPND